MLAKATVTGALALALVVCGSAAASHQSGSSVLAANHSASGTLVTLHKTKLGKVIATRSGKTLYLYTPDAKNKSNCYGSCSSVWPPMMAKGKLRAGKGVKSALLKTTLRKNGKRQVTYNGHPLYQYVGDSNAGQVSGEGYQGIWYAVNTSGKAVKHASGGTATTTNPYGY
jgi:predicted lipoprotein with Yx(FWY)xxD motif